MASKSKYINYVDYVYKLKAMSGENILDEMYFLKTKLRMCEQEQRRRRNNQRTLEQVKEWENAAK